MKRERKYINIDDVTIPKELFKVDFYEQSEYIELAIPLFERCNLNCKFCFEDHISSKIDYEEIRNIPYKIIDQLEKEIQKLNPKEILLRLWGGELFFDTLPDEIFDVYRKLINNFKQVMQERHLSQKIDINFLSNGVFTKYDRVDSLLKDTGASISFSYDPIDRFSSESQKDIWLNTLTHYKNKTRYVSITLTEQSIDKYIEGDTYFDKIPEYIGIDVNYYTANPNWRDLLPGDDDFYRFFKWGIENKKYNIRVIGSLLKYMIPEEKVFVERYCDCKFALQYQNGTCIKDCSKRASTLDRSKFYGKYTSDIDEDNVTEAKSTLGLLKRGCLECAHYDYCHMTCWIALLFDEYKVTKCPFARAYDYISNEDVQNYKTWRKRIYDLYGASL